jgi:hypothetical protein
MAELGRIQKGNNYFKENSMQRRKFVFAVLVTGLATLLVASSIAPADVVADWNAIATQTALQTVIPPVRPGPSAILDLAMVHAAMHDAIQAFEGRFESYGAPIPNASGSPVAAAARAAHDVLVARFPNQSGTLDTIFDDYLNGLGLMGNEGEVVGHQAAANILNLRAGDGSFPSNPEDFRGGPDPKPGDWRPTLPVFASMAAPWLGAVLPFTLKESTQLRPSPPPHLESGKYAREYNEVKSLGRAGTNSSRTQEQTDLALFYSDNFIALWERTLRGIGGTVNNVGDNARLFALANLAAADAIITAWDSKRFYHFWRPITAIQLGDNDGNPETVGDATWLPLIPTPPYPEYTSGANNLTGAMTRSLELLFGDKTTFSVTSLAVNKTKTYHRFSDMADDVVNVRIYQGIHFRTADKVARRQGTRAADWAFRHVLRPIDDDHNDDDDDR